MMYPTIRLQDVASHFGVSGAWLSTVIHSDAFQALLRMKQDVQFHHTVLPLREKMNSIAHQVLDRMVDIIPYETEVSNLNKVAENVLDRLGYGSKTPGVQINVQNNHVTTLRSEIEEARQLMNRGNNSIPVSLANIPSDGVEVYIDGQRSPISLPREAGTRVGEDNTSTDFYQESTTVLSP